jgi:hypothetical protein
MVLSGTVTGAWHFGQPMSRLEAAASISSGVWQVGHLKYNSMISLLFLAAFNHGLRPKLSSASKKFVK